jgi:hypothetical protein
VVFIGKVYRDDGAMEACKSLIAQASEETRALFLTPVEIKVTRFSMAAQPRLLQPKQTDDA